jgi:hypothetical protein
MSGKTPFINKGLIETRFLLYFQVHGLQRVQKKV